MKCTANEQPYGLAVPKVASLRNAPEVEAPVDQRHYAASSVERCISIANDLRSLPAHAAATIFAPVSAAFVIRKWATDAGP